MRKLLYIILPILGLLLLPKLAAAGIIIRPVFNTGLVGYWDFQEGAGNIAYDKSGKMNNGTLENMATSSYGGWTDGKIEKGLEFDGIDDDVDITNDASLTFSSSYTVMAWVNAKSLLRTDVTQWSSIITKGGTGETAAFNHNYLLGYSGNSFFGTVDRWLFSLENAAGSNCNIVGDVAANTDEWYHVVGVFDDAANKIFLYVNGLQTQTSCALIPNTNNRPVRIGYDESSAAVPWDGKIDEVRIYNRALSESEISRLYKLSAPKIMTASQNGLVGYWSFDDGGGTKIGDMSGNGNAGTWAGSGSHWTDGKIGKGGIFNGTDDMISFSSNANINLQNNINTVSMWVNIRAVGPNSYAELYSVTDGLRTGIMWENFSQFRIGVDANGDFYNYFVNADLAFDKWTHVVVEIDRIINKAKVYIDGIYKGQTDQWPSYTPTAGTSKIGANALTGHSEDFLKGKIDEVRIYNRALEQSEITALYNSGLVKINTSQNNQLTNGLVGLWSFNGTDIDGNTAIDRSVSGNNGTITGAIPTIGKSGQALSFSGSSNYVRIGDPANNSLDFGTGSFSFGLWVYVGSTVGDYDMPWFKGGGSAGQPGYGIALGNNDWDAGVADADEALGVNFSQTPISNRWVHLFVVVDRSKNLMTAYLDGGQSDTQNISTLGTTTNSTNAYIGTGDPSNFPFKGKIDEVRIYNRALSAEEVLRLYNLGR